MFPYEYRHEEHQEKTIRLDLTDRIKKKSMSNFFNKTTKNQSKTCQDNVFDIDFEDDTSILCPLDVDKIHVFYTQKLEVADAKGLKFKRESKYLRKVKYMSQ